MGRTRWSGPLRSTGGYEIGSGATNTTVINSAGNLAKASMVSTAALADGAVTVDKLSNTAFWENLMKYQFGVGGIYDKTDNGTNVLFTAGSAGTRKLLAVVRITGDFEDSATDDQPTFKLEEAAGREIFEAGDFDDAQEGDMFVYTLDDYDNEKNLQLVVATDDGDGEINLMVFLGPLET